MASVKKVTTANGTLAPYDIYANVITLHGNLNVIGNTSTINSTNTNLKDNIIVLNDGETGSGVSLGNAGVYINRGLVSNVAILWRESTGTWQLTNDGATFANILTSGSGGGAAGGLNTQVQFNNNGTLYGNSYFTWGGGNLAVYNTVIGNGNVTTSSGDLTLSATSTVFVNKTLKLGFQASAPTNVASTVQVFANTAGTGNSGLWVVNNSTAGDELITKMRAIAFNLIFK